MGLQRLHHLGGSALQHFNPVLVGPAGKPQGGQRQLREVTEAEWGIVCRQIIYIL